MTPAQLAEARAARLAVARRHPTLAWDGFHETPPLGDANLDRLYEQIATALAYLRAHPPTKPTSSYRLKHEAERWGREHGCSAYVPTGALIMAAVFLGCALGRRRGLNVDLVMRREQAA